MKNKTLPSIVVYHFDTKHPLEKESKRIAERCTGEIVSLCSQLDFIAKQMAGSLRRKDIGDMTRECLFHHENYLFRVYALRERAWDILAALSDRERQPTERKAFRETVFSVLKKTYPDLYKSFSSLYTLIEADIELRNVATHRTFLFFGLASKEDLSDFQEIESMLDWFDSESKAGIEIQKTLRLAIRKFVTRETNRIQEITKSAFEFASYCQGAINSKSWLTPKERRREVAK